MPPPLDSGENPLSIIERLLFMLLSSYISIFCELEEREVSWVDSPVMGIVMCFSIILTCFDESGEKTLLSERLGGGSGLFPYRLDTRLCTRNFINVAPDSVEFSLFPI